MFLLQFAKEAPERAKKKNEAEKKTVGWWNWLTGGDDEEEEENIHISINEDKGRHLCVHLSSD